MEKKGRNDSLIMTLVGVVILLGVGIFVLVLFNGTKKESEVSIEGNKLVVKGQYGITYDLGDISGVQLVDDIPNIEKKVNGAGLGEIKKGDFEVEGLGISRLFVHSGKGPFIYIIVNSKYTIMNFYSASKTEEVYQELKEALQEHKK